MKKKSILVILLSLALASFSQINYTAHDTITPYEGAYGYGSNSGYFPPHNNTVTSNLAAGNSAAGVQGAGCRSYRSTIPDNHITTWGLTVDYATWQHYFNLGLKENVAFVGYPHASHQDPSIYCPSRNAQSGMFQGMYLPIWDAGANGTPYNDNNLYAKYLWQVVTLYKDYVRFWEIWNEPDFDGGANGWKPPTVSGNWWGRDDFGCELIRFNGSIYDYVRLLRVSWEIIKYIDPDAYVTTGGIGYESFLDAILRNTDNPVDGSVTAAYPLTGGAYFDVLCYHVYPQFEPETRYYDLNLSQWVNKRHSDAGSDGVANKKGRFEQVLFNRGYNGITYPEKHWIVTEHNVGRRPFGHSLGGEELQRNYMIKTQVTQQLAGVVQSYVYGLSETKPLNSANSTFDLMGLYASIANQPAYSQPLASSGIANLSMSQILFGTKVDTARTASMNLPANVGGGAFRQPTGGYEYILWAKTTIDESESASAVYSFPPSFGTAPLTRREWNFSQTGTTTTSPTNGITLTGTPIFLSASPPLPVELIAFDAVTTQENEVLVSWATAAENGNDYFTIERSLDGDFFESMEKVTAQGATSVSTSYERIDRMPIPGRSYYRLKQTDLNGSFSYSHIVEVWIIDSDEFTVEIYPNPIERSKSLNLEILLQEAGTIDIELQNLTGSIAMREEKEVANGENLVKLDISALNLGCYYLVMSKENHQVVRKVIIYK